MPLPLKQQATFYTSNRETERGEGSAPYNVRGVCCFCHNLLVETTFWSWQHLINKRNALEIWCTATLLKIGVVAFSLFKRSPSSIDMSCTSFDKVISWFCLTHGSNKMSKMCSSYATKWQGSHLLNKLNFETVLERYASKVWNKWHTSIKLLG